MLTVHALFMQEVDSSQPDEVDRLTSLPEPVLCHIASWCADARTIAALHGTCHPFHRLRNNPAAAALFLVRCSCKSYGRAISVCRAAAIPAASVIQQLIQLQHASPTSGGPHIVPAPLLDILLQWPCDTGDAASVATLLALPHPPDLRVDRGLALHVALCAEPPHLAVVQLLLEAGASPCVPPDYETTSYNEILHFSCHADDPDHLPALKLLIQFCPPSRLSAALNVTLSSAIETHNWGTIAYLVPLSEP